MASNSRARCYLSMGIHQLPQTALTVKETEPQILQTTCCHSGHTNPHHSWSVKPRHKTPTQKTHIFQGTFNFPWIRPTLIIHDFKKNSPGNQCSHLWIHKLQQQRKILIAGNSVKVHKVSQLRFYTYWDFRCLVILTAQLEPCQIHLRHPHQLLWLLRTKSNVLRSRITIPVKPPAN